MQKRLAGVRAEEAEKVKEEEREGQEKVKREK